MSMHLLTQREVSLTYSVPKYEDPPINSDKLLLLTVGGVLVQGHWSGRYGEFYLAWAPLPKTDKMIHEFVTYMWPNLKDIVKIDWDGKVIRLRNSLGEKETWQKSGKEWILL